jgi:hypothetical protein
LPGTKHCNLEEKFVNYVQKKFYNIGPISDTAVPSTGRRRVVLENLNSIEGATICGKE